MKPQGKLLCFLFLICKTAAQSISESLNAFSIDLLKTTISECDPSSNLALSPFTVWTLLSIVDEGARQNTAKEIETVLRIPSVKRQFRNDFSNMSNILLQPDYGVNLDISNAIFVTASQSLKTDFRDVSRKFYGVDVQSINFQNTNRASQTINKYITQATKNRIRGFVNPDDLTDAAIFISSALYFKGAWQVPFNKSATKPEAFYDDNQKKLGDVTMMYQAGEYPYTRMDFLKGFGVEIPYGNGNKMSMIVILPYKSQTLLSTVELMSRTPFGRVIDALNKAKEEFLGEETELFLPKFSIQSDLTMNVVLHKMGIRDVFNEQEANLLGIFPHYLSVSKLIQKAEIEVNEEGTVASAASGAAFAYKSPSPKFMANRPFLYFIVDKTTRGIVFAGKISSPP